MSPETMRDRIAMAALQGLLACPSMRGGMSTKEYVAASFQCADAFLAARGGDAPQPQQGDAVKQQMLAALRECAELLAYYRTDKEDAQAIGRAEAAIAAAEKEHSGD